jgi:hypothetical protein
MPGLVVGDDVPSARVGGVREHAVEIIASERGRGLDI